MKTRSLWKATAVLPSFPRLEQDMEVDVLLVGGGIAGLTAAVLLRRAGKSVALIEAARIGGGETGRTTAHLTELLDQRYHELESTFGPEEAVLAAESSRASIDLIEAWVREFGVREFSRVAAYLYAETSKQRDELATELESLRRVGARAAWADTTPLPWEVTAAVRIEGQARFHPLEYLRALAVEFVSDGGRVFEQSRMVDLDDGEPCRVQVNGRTVTARDVLVMAGVPVSNRFAIHTKIAAYRTYAVAAPVESGRLPPDLFLDMHEPYHYTRTHEKEEGTFLIVGGEDHKTGTSDHAEEAYEKLEKYTRAHFGVGDFAYRWSGQIIEPADGLPFIGRNSGSRHVYVATGFSGTGMTFGTLSGMILADAVLGRPNRWTDLYAATRVKPLAQAARYLAENVDFPSHLASDRVRRGDSDRIETVRAGEGCLVRSGGKMLAVYRDQGGKVHCRSAVCTHLGCYVRWNGAEGTWDCPCHGSRFDVDGKVLNGPAISGLEPASPEPDPTTPPGVESPTGN